jgi:hypothetical protein
MKMERESLNSRGTVLAVAGLFLVLWGLLYLEGRPAWCKYGFGIWTAAWTHCTSQNLLDPYSLTHVLHGVIFYWALRPLEARISLRWRLVAAVAIEVGWELLENSPWVIERYRQDTASLDYTGDSIVNSLADTAAAVIGFVFAARVSWKVALAVFIVIEIGLLIFVRDNLTLNVVMLFYPLESLKEWQLHGW